MERDKSLAPYGIVRGTEESPEEARSEGAPQLQWRREHFGDAWCFGMTAKASSSVPEPTR